MEARDVGRVIEERAVLSRASRAVAFSGLAREAAVVGSAILFYFGVRNRTQGDPGAALANAHRIVDLERALGIDWESAVQSVALSSHVLVTLANWVYIFGHWPVIIGVGVALYVYRRPHYYLLRNAMFVSGMIGFLLFALFPVAPPRLSGLGLVDTVTERSRRVPRAAAARPHERVRGIPEPACGLESPHRHRRLPRRGERRRAGGGRRAADRDGLRRGGDRQPLS